MPTHKIPESRGIKKIKYEVKIIPVSIMLDSVKQY